MDGYLDIVLVSSITCHTHPEATCTVSETRVGVIWFVLVVVLTPKVLDGEALKIEEEKLRAIGQRNRYLAKSSARKGDSYAKICVVHPCHC